MATDKLGNILNGSGNADLQRLVRRARRLEGLAAALSRSLPAELSGDLVAANVREGGELVVVCRTPARAARIRYESQALLAAARAAGETVDRLTVRVSQPR